MSFRESLWLALQTSPPSKAQNSGGALVSSEGFYETCETKKTGDITADNDLRPAAPLGIQSASELSGFHSLHATRLAAISDCLGRAVKVYLLAIPLVNLHSSIWLHLSIVNKSTGAYPARRRLRC